jgi:EmrB/QacA subfamily drug resistance transporter
VSGSLRNLPALPFIIGAAILMQMMDSTIVVAVLPTMAQSFEVDVLDLNAVVTSYLIGAAVVLPLSGWAADRFGARMVFVSAIVGFTLLSLACAMAQSAPQLMVLRTLQGCAGGFLLPVGRIVLLRSTPANRLIDAMAYFMMPALIGPILGPPLGGLIVNAASWPWIFLINIPIGVLCVALSLRFIPATPEVIAPRLDVPGVMMIGAMLACCGIGIEKLTSVGELLQAGVWFASAAGLALGYILHARRTASPALDFALMRNPTFSAATLGGFFTRLLAGGTPFLLALFLQVGLGMDPFKAGLLTTALALGALSMRIAARRSVDRFGFRHLLIANAFLAAGSLAILALVGPQSSPFIVALVLCAHGFLRSLQMTSVTSLAYEGLDRSRMGSATTLAGVFQALAQCAGVAVATMALRGAMALDQAPAPTLDHLRLAVIVLAVLTLASVVWFLKLPPTAGETLRRNSA